jgi:LAS superfamily LD-carboxypeptidase LdcB
VLSSAQIIGTDDSHVYAVEANDSPQRLERKTLAAFYQLRQAAAEDGIDLTVASGYRDFFRQRSIWNNKALGNALLRDEQGDVVAFDGLNETQLLSTIMRWSALPGASRHHWGSDFDVYDRAAVDDGYSLQLIPEEYQTGGVFAGLTAWLDAQWQQGRFTDFYRPYDRDRGGVAPEPWHLSYRPVSEPCQDLLTPELLSDCWHQHDIALSKQCLSNLEVIFQRYIVL